MSRSFVDWMTEGVFPENRFLEEMERIIPWKAIDELLETHLPNKGGGRPPYPLQLMLRMTLIQWWHGLGDLQTEFECADKLSFRRFLGLGLNDRIPDGTTLEDFRHKMEACQLQVKLHELLNGLMERRGLFVKTGTLVDATFVKASRPKADPDRKHGKKGNGYSAHVGVHQGTKLIRKVAVTDASVHDSQCLEAVIPENPGKVYADLGYYGLPCRATITGKGGTPRIGYKKPKNKTLEGWKKALNKKLSKIRSRVEHVFASWQTRFKLKNSRYAGLPKVTAFMNGMSVAYNLARLGFLLRRCKRLSWA
jgi:transposase, IS5 family